MSYHVRRLHALRFLELVKRVPRRGAVEHYYTTVAGPTITNEAWRSIPTIVKHATISAALEEVGSQAIAAVALGGFDNHQSHLSRTPVVVDHDGWKAIARELDALLPRIQEIEAESQRRLRRNNHQEQKRATVALMLFQTHQGTPPEQPPEHNRDRPGKAGNRRRSAA